MPASPLYALWASGQFVTHLDVRIERVTLAGTVMQSYRNFSGLNWIKSLSFTPAGVDQPVGSGTLVLHRSVGGKSLAPFVTGSPLNQSGSTYLPAVDYGREIEIYTCILPLGEEPEESDWIRAFGGLTDDPEFGGKGSGEVTVPFRDYTGALSENFVRNETKYGDPDDPPDAIEVMQQILDQWMGEGQYYILDLTEGAGFAVTELILRDISILDADTNLAQQWGAKRLEQRWNPAAERWGLAVIDPDRNKTDVDYEVSPSTYLDVANVGTDNKNLRTLVKGTAKEGTSGRLLFSQIPEEEDISDDPLVRLFGVKPLAFTEDEASAIDTQPELDEMVAAIYADVSNPPFPLEPETLYCPFAQVDDLVRWKANKILWDEDREAAVLLLTHEFSEGGKARTRWKCSGRPKGGYASYRNLGVEVRGRGQRPTIFSTSLSAAVLGKLTVNVDLGSDVVWWERWDGVGALPKDMSGVPIASLSKGSDVRSVRSATWSVKNGTHYVLVRAYTQEDAWIETFATIDITGVPGDGEGGATPTLVPSTPYISSDVESPPYQYVSVGWLNTSYTLPVELQFVVNGAVRPLVYVAPDTEGYDGFYATPGDHVKVAARYTNGTGHEGPWSPFSREIVLGEVI